MQRALILTLTSLMAFVLITSCSNNGHKKMLQRLITYDAIIDVHPSVVRDSLQLIDYHDLSRSNRAYYGLLKVISDDKTYVNFTSDSLVNAVSEYYRQHDPKNRNYIRSLAYQGIVRTRMGVKDSTVFEPLKEAERLLSSLYPPDPSLGYLVNYFLGNIHYNNRNYSTAYDYFQQTLF